MQAGFTTALESEGLLPDFALRTSTKLARVHLLSANLGRGCGC